MEEKALPSRRFTTRVKTPEGVWVLWRCDGFDDLSRVRDLSVGGLFLETDVRKSVGSRTELHFLVQEGQIRADAIVRRFEPRCGLGLKFTAVRGEDRSNLEALVDRFHNSSQSLVTA